MSNGNVVSTVAPREARDLKRKLAACGAFLAGLSMSAAGILAACSGGTTETPFNNGGGSGGSSSGANSSGSGSSGSSSSGGEAPPNLGPGKTTGSDDAGSSVEYTDGGCQGLQCQQFSSCGDGGGTTISGKILDPAGANPLYNVLAYVPMYDPADPSKIPSGAGIEPIAGGVTFPSGVTCDSCSYLYSGNPIAVGTSGTDGTFTITNAPTGTNIPIVIQIGKWRTHTTIAKVTACTDNNAGNINLPSSADGSDPIVSMPQIAISMGGADTMECLPYRMGISLSEFTSGASSSGHIHIFTGGDPGGGFGGSSGGSGPPAGSTALWDSISDLEKYDVTLFSCEGDETYDANPQVLEQYVNAGGRAFASHYHYAWLTGPLKDKAGKGGGGGGGGGHSYTANADWGNNLASWNNDDPGASGNTVGATIDTTLNVGGGAFAKGEALQSWLGTVGALGTSGVASNEVAIDGPSFDPNVTSANTVSQPWATYDSTAGAGTYTTAYFSFNTPVAAVAPPDGGAAPYCGRVVFSGLHVGAADGDLTGGSSVPTSSTCSPGPGMLSAQEKVLEFMLFDLSSCVTPDKSAPGVPIVVPPPPVPQPK
jgi:hypothetical protein